VPKYPFLSDEWVTEARRIYSEAEETAGVGVIPSGALAPVRVNLIVAEAPFSASPLDAHVDTSSGTLTVDTGHLENPDVTVSMAYDTARSLFVQGDIQAVMQAFLGGRIKVDGDLTKLLDPHSGIWPAAAPLSSASAAGGEPSAGQQRLGGARPEAVQVAKRLQEMTE
jgi:hypothetical protein